MEWKPIEYYEGLYEVSDHGQVRNSRGQILAFDKNSNGYKFVHLYRNSERVHHLVHRLVAKAFVPRKNYKQLEVNHIDCDKENNHYTNLEWVTGSQNMNRYIDKRLSKTQVPVTLKGAYSEYKFPSSKRASMFLNRNDDYVSNAIRNKKTKVTDTLGNEYIIILN